MSIILLITAILSLILATLVILRDQHKKENISFFCLGTAISLWTLGVDGFLVAKNNIFLAIVSYQIFYIVPLFIGLFSVLYSKYFSYEIKFKKFYIYILVILAVSMSFVLLFDKKFLIYQIFYDKPVLVATLDKAHYLIYSFFLSIFFISTIVIMFIKRSSVKLNIFKQQSKILLFGYLVSFLSGIFFNLILPYLGNFSLIAIGPICTLFFLTAISYSIIKHKQFNITFVVARSLGYFLSLMFFIVLCAAIVFFITKVILNLKISIIAQTWLSVSIAIASFMFASLKRRFDSLTNKLFYKDAYNSQDLFDSLNKVLVSNTNLKNLLKLSSEVIERYLKSEYCYIGLRDNRKNIRIASTSKIHLSVAMINSMLDKASINKSGFIITDSLGLDQYDLIEVLQANKISFIISFQIDNKSNNKDETGILILGNKKSGSAYLNNDYKVLSILVKELAIAVQNALSYERVRELNNNLELRINQATKKLRDNNTKLKQLDESKDDFISMASHQLRTPLTSVKGYISMVLEGDAGKLTKMQHEMLRQAFFSSQRMVYLIADLLNVSRLKTGKFIIEPSKVNLAQMVNQEISQLEDTAEARSLKLIYQQPAVFPDLMLDETKIRQVVMNFIDNAIYYTPAGGEIKVKVLDLGNTIEFRVEDNGIGVPKSEQPHLFTKFYRATNARKTRPDGTGLGLYMAKKVIIAEHGSIIFESQEGKGSTFGFIFNKGRLDIA